MNIKGEIEYLLIYNEELSNWYAPHMHPKTDFKAKSLIFWGIYRVSVEGLEPPTNGLKGHC